MIDGRATNLSVEDVLANLRENWSRIKTAILLVQPDRIADIPDVAARLNIESIDYSVLLLTSGPSESEYMPISAAREEQQLYGLVSGVRSSDCLLVYNVDLAISAMDPLERETFWKNLLQNFPVSRTNLLLVMPVAAHHLLPYERNYTEWKSSGRLGHMKI